MSVSLCLSLSPNDFEPIVRLQWNLVWIPCHWRPKIFTNFNFHTINNTYVNVAKIFRTESITKFGITRWEAKQSFMAAKLIRLAQKIAINLHLVAESCTICSSRPVRKLLDTVSYMVTVRTCEVGATGSAN